MLYCCELWTFLYIKNMRYIRRKVNISLLPYKENKVNPAKQPVGIISGEKPSRLKIETVKPRNRAEVTKTIHMIMILTSQN